MESSALKPLGAGISRPFYHKYYRCTLVWLFNICVTFQLWGQQDWFVFRASADNILSRKIQDSSICHVHSYTSTKCSEMYKALTHCYFLRPLCCICLSDVQKACYSSLFTWTLCHSITEESQWSLRDGAQRIFDTKLWGYVVPTIQVELEYVGLHEEVKVIKARIHSIIYYNVESLYMLNSRTFQGTLGKVHTGNVLAVCSYSLTKKYGHSCITTPSHNVKVAAILIVQFFQDFRLWWGQVWSQWIYRWDSSGIEEDEDEPEEEL